MEFNTLEEIKTFIHWVNNQSAMDCIIKKEPIEENGKFVLDPEDRTAEVENFYQQYLTII
jgi:hypothetical protein